MSVRVTIVGDFAIYDGYGSMNVYMARGMHRTGARVSVLPLFLDPRGCDEEFLHLIADSPARLDGPVLYATWPARPEFGLLRGTDLFARTMYESSKIPPHWAAQLNRTRAVIVASHYVADIFRACGVTAPVYVVPDGVDPEVYPYQDRPRRAGMTTLMVGMMQPRKHYREGVAAWLAAFGDDPDARLVIKSKQGWTDGFVPPDPRIHVDISSEPTRGIAHWYRRADVLMALGSEGFGIPLIEGMATGLPVIALDAAGQADVCRDAGDLVLSVKPSTWRPHQHYGSTEVYGLVPVPGIADVTDKLCWVAQHRDEAAELGRAASAWVHRNRNVWNYGPDVLAVIEEHARTRGSLRRRGFPAIDRPLRPARQAARVASGLSAQDDDPVPHLPLWSYCPERGSSLGIVTLCTPQIEEWAWPHVEDKRSYCERHGFAFYGYGDVLAPSRAPTWSKIPALRRHLADHEWLLWTDADAAIVNFTFDARELCDDDYDLVVTHDHAGFNAGTFLIRNSPGAHRFLLEVWRHHVATFHFEQTAMAAVMEEDVSLRVKVAPKRSMNSYWFDYQPGDFIIHAAGEPVEKKAAILAAFRLRSAKV